MHWTRFNYSFSFRSNVQYGVPQSSVLDGLFFTINMVDLFYEYKDGKITKHANDTTLYYFVIQKQPPEVIEQGVLKGFTKFTGKHLCQAPSFIKKEILAQVFSCEFCKFFTNTFFTEHLWTTAHSYWYAQYDLKKLQATSAKCFFH